MIERKGRNRSTYIYMDWRPYDASDVTKSRYCDFNLLTLLLSAGKARVCGHKTVFYTDPQTVRFLEDAGLMEAWDRVDGEALDREVDKNACDVRTFINTGKFYALQREKAPCALIDTDFIPWADTDAREKKFPVVFTHWEQAYPENAWYPAKENLPVPDGYHWNPAWDFTLPAANTSFLSFSDTEAKDGYCREALRYLYKNHVPVDRKNACVCFVEQKILTMYLEECGLLDRTGTLIGALWDPDAGKFISFDKPLKGWRYDAPDPKEKVTHTWISKQAIAQNRRYRDYYCAALLLEMQKTMPETIRILEARDDYQRYFRLIEKYHSIQAMEKAGAIMTSLTTEKSKMPITAGRRGAYEPGDFYGEGTVCGRLVHGDG